MDIEEQLYCHLANPESVLYLRAEGFDTELIYGIQVRSFAKWIFNYLNKHGNPPNRETIEEEWEDYNPDDPKLDISYLLERLRDRYTRNQRQIIIEELVDTESTEDFKETLIDRSFKLWKVTSSQRHVLTSADHVETINRIIYDRENQTQGASFGFDPLDKISLGARGGHLSFLAARPKRYKTWIALKAFVEQRRQGLTPAFFSLELTQDEIYERLACMVSDTSFVQMTRGRLMTIQKKKVFEAMEKFEKLGPAYLISQPYESRQVDDLVREAQRIGADSVIVDQLSYLQPREKHLIKHEGFAEIVLDMKGAAVKMDIPWYCVCQFNREAASLDEMAGADKAGLTRAIEETCDIFLGLQRNEENKKNHTVTMGIVEARHCDSGIEWEIEVDLTGGSSFCMIDE